MDTVFFNTYPKVLLDELKAYKTNSIHKNVHYPKFLFLCGKAPELGQKTNRDWIQDYYIKNATSIVPILSETLWETESSEYKLDLLTFEDFLAEASDFIILFIESYGTACELGAFAITEKLFKKLIIINDNEFVNTKSFINDGPVRKLINEKKENVIYTDLNAIFSNPKVVNKLTEIAFLHKRLTINKDYSRIQLNSFIIEMLELISILQPVKQSDLISIYKNVKNFNYRFEFDRIKINIKQVFNFLEMSNLIYKNGDDYMNIAINIPRIQFMFEMTNYQFNRIRTKFLVRKYKYDPRSYLKKVESFC